MKNNDQSVSASSASSAAHATEKQASPSVRDQIPATVDLDKVFNQYEYERRQAAEVSKKQAVTVTPNETAATSDSRKEEQMKLEMEQMIVKMRDYKAKDPSLFSQIWEQVKKVSDFNSHLRSWTFR